MSSLPKLLYMVEKLVQAEDGKIYNGVAYFECPLISLGKGNTETEISENVAVTYCSKCGYHSTCIDRNFQFFCFASNNPYLTAVKEQLRKIGVDV